jgi:hypothetical protein
VLSSVTSAPNEAELHCHVAESTKSDHAQLVAFTNFPMAERRVGCDSRAQERRHFGERELVRQPEHEILVHDDLL